MTIYSVSAYEFCEETISENILKIRTIIDNSQSNEESWTWSPTEKVSVEVEIKNKNLTQRTFTLELFTLNEDLNPKNITTSENDLVKTFTLEESEIKTINFTFTLDEPGEKTYYLYAKLFDPNNKSVCTSLKALSESEETTINIEKDKNIITIKNITGPTNVTLGEPTNYTVKVINLGNTKEDRVSVTAYNTKLGIKEKGEIIGLGVEETKSVTISITIPKNATTMQIEKLLFIAEFEYDNETGYYYDSVDKAKGIGMRIITPPNETITKQNETINTTTQINQTIIKQNQTNLKEKNLENTITNNAFLITASILGIIIIITIVFFLKKFLKNSSKNPKTQSTAINDYIQKIKKTSASTLPAQNTQSIKKIPPTKNTKPVEQTPPTQNTKPVEQLPPTKQNPSTPPSKPAEKNT